MNKPTNEQIRGALASDISDQEIERVRALFAGEIEALQGDKMRIVKDYKKLFGRVMILCDKCGNKRCPHATDENYDCTNSNEPGQEGSIYA